VLHVGWGIAYNYTEGFDEQARAETLEDDERVEYFETYYDELVKAIRYRTLNPKP
jgi:hypothetical protein